MKNATLLGFLILTGALPAIASSEEEELVTQVEALFSTSEAPQAPGSEGTKHRCATMVLHEARTRLSQLSDSSRARIEPLIGPPVNPANPPNRPQMVQTWSLETAHFVIQYTTAGFDKVPGEDLDRNQTPDYVEKISSALETSWAKEFEEMGFEPPSTDKILVSLRRITALGFAVPSSSYPVVLELDVALDATEDYRNTQVLEATCAHELFHLSQFKYSTSEPSWLMESTAMWIEKHVFPESLSYLDHAPTRMMYPQRALLAEGSDSIQYALVLFMNFMEQTRGGVTFMRNLWEDVRTLSAEEALVKNVGDLPEAALEWSCDAYQANAPDYAKIAPMARFVVETLPAVQSLPEGTQVEYLGCSVIEIRAPTEPSAASLALTFQADGMAAMRVVLFDREGGSSVLKVTGSPGPSLSISIPGFQSKYEKVGVVVMGMEKAKAVGYHLSASLTADPLHVP